VLDDVYRSPLDRQQGKIDISDLYVAQSENDAALLAYVQALRGAWLAHYRLRRLTLYDYVTGRPL